MGASIPTTAGGVPLKAVLRRIQRKQTIEALMLLTPLLVFLSITFVLPIGSMLLQGVDNPEVRNALPRTAEAIGRWEGEGLPSEAIYGALVADLQEKHGDRLVIGRLAKRLNHEIEGARTLIFSTAARVSSLSRPPYKNALINVDSRWGETRYWTVIKRNTFPYTDFYLLTAIDLRRDVVGQVGAAPADEAIFRRVFGRTLWISGLVTLTCLVLGYPVAHLLAMMPARTANLLMFFVLLPFWTSVLVRTTAWLVLLQRSGVVNDFLLKLGAISHPLELVFNRIGVLIAMTHVLLPFMILPLYGVMKGIDPHHVRAARSLGANAAVAFVRVYLPQTLPGISAGCLIVMISALGFYITPAIVGGAKEHMVSTFIVHYVDILLNWGQASALASILLILVLLLYVIWNRLVGIDKMRIG